MKYSFDKIIDRTNTNSLKYDFAIERGKPCGLLSLWVADMDFQAPPEVLNSLHELISHGIFGYTDAKEDYYNAIISWFELYFNFSFSKQDIVKTPGVVFSIAQAISAFTNLGAGVIIQTPVYYPFYSLIENNGRRIIENPLILKDNMYIIDFYDFEKKIIDEKVELFILCSPHNPVGRVWTENELKRLNEICKKHNVIVVSDEIHCDFAHRGYKHICFGGIDNNAIIMTSPGKTFNLAGLNIANIIIKNPNLRKKFIEQVNKTGYSQPNSIGLFACQSAYLNGGEWLKDLKEYLLKNIDFVKDFLSLHLPKIKLIEPQGTYLLWLDFSEYNLPQNELDRRITEGAGLWLSSGTIFGKQAEGFQRINVACPNSILEKALLQLKKEFN